MSQRTANENVKVWRLPALPRLELMRATYVQQFFSRHTHEGFAVGVIEKGALGFFYRGENVIASRGAINIANPDEAHTGHAAAPEGWTYRMFYLDPEMLKRAACQIAGREVPLPFFHAGVIHDDYLAQLIARVHISIEQLSTPAMEQETLVLIMLSHLIRRHSDAPASTFPLRNERSSVRRTKDYIDAHWRDDIPIRLLADIAHLSPYHFIRVFHKQMGMPPHGYLKQVRVRRAKDLLERGRPIAAAALESGFVDQSHLTRSFKSILGFTPGQFSNFVQYAHKGFQDNECL